MTPDSSCLGTNTSIKSCGVQLVLRSQTSPLRKMSTLFIQALEINMNQVFSELQNKKDNIMKIKNMFHILFFSRLIIFCLISFTCFDSQAFLQHMQFLILQNYFKVKSQGNKLYASLWFYSVIQTYHIWLLCM